jgi:hypothetical protein
MEVRVRDHSDFGGVRLHKPRGEALEVGIQHAACLLTLVSSTSGGDSSHQRWELKKKNSVGGLYICVQSN